jgi:predicted glycoside hydrolase/deacetylase ChbG (UPF0249 family)
MQHSLHARFVGALVIILGSLCGQPFLRAQTLTIAERLGYPKDAKLLIVHADDLGMAYSIDRATFKALRNHDVSSASAMVPCPWFTEVVDFARKNPDADIGLHLTLTSEWMTYRWGPLAPRDKVTSLLDPEGYFYRVVPGTVEKGQAAEVEREIRAQIEFALHLGLHPTHLDPHMGTLYRRRDFYDVFVKVGHEYHLPTFTLPEVAAKGWLSMLSPKDIKVDGALLIGQDVKPVDWKQTYLRMVDEIKPGLNQMVVHLGYDDTELGAITHGYTVYEATWRQRDFDFVRSADFREAIRRNHIIVVNWRQIDKLLQ